MPDGPIASSATIAGAPGQPNQAPVGRPLSHEELGQIDAYWRAANYLSVGQIYLLDNPLLREPLAPEHGGVLS